MKWTSQIFRWLYSDLVIVNDLLQSWVQSLNDHMKKNAEEVSAHNNLLSATIPFNFDQFCIIWMNEVWALDIHYEISARLCVCVCCWFTKKRQCKKKRWFDSPLLSGYRRVCLPSYTARYTLHTHYIRNAVEQIWIRRLCVVCVLCSCTLDKSKYRHSTCLGLLFFFSRFLLIRCLL